MNINKLLQRSFPHRTFHKMCTGEYKQFLGKHNCDVITQRQLGTKQTKGGKDYMSTVMYVTAAGIVMLGVCYASVPLYRIFCQSTGRGGQSAQGKNVSKVEIMQPIKERELTIKFSAEKGAAMRWNFKPLQQEVKVVPGETALAFYKAENPTDKPIIGISTYTIVPWEAGQYFNKIQCFCFEEQRLNPKESVDMPVFFFIDPDFHEDPFMDKVDEILLSYTFFEAKDGDSLPYPGYAIPNKM